MTSDNIMLNIFKTSNSKKTFEDAPTTAVFTTKFVIEENKLITYVTHEIKDAAWQFFSDDEFENFEVVARIVRLQEIVDRDNSLLEIADLPLGYIATRESKNDKWKILKKN